MLDLLAIQAWLYPIIREAGAMALKGLESVLDRQMKGTHDFATEMDLKIEDFLVSSIKEKFPDHNFLTEERNTLDQQSEYTWVIDPIDGTKNYFRKLPLFCISVALQHQGIGVMGVVYAPKTNECFHAVAGGGAYLNDQKIRISGITELGKAHLAADYRGYNANPESNLAAMKTLTTLGQSCDRLRAYGAAALALAYVAAGSFEMYLDIGGSAYEWDYAAGRILVQEAGGIFRILKDGTRAAGSAELVDAVEKIIT